MIIRLLIPLILILYDLVIENKKSDTPLQFEGHLEPTFDLESQQPKNWLSTTKLVQEQYKHLMV